MVIFLRTPEELIDHVRQVLTLLYDAGVTLNRKKPEFSTNCIDYLGHVTRPARLEVSTRATDAICELKFLTTVTKLRSLSGLCLVFRQFVPKFARVAAPLNKKLFEGQQQTFHWPNEDDISALQMLKVKSVEHPVLALSRILVPFVKWHWVNTPHDELQRPCTSLGSVTAPIVLAGRLVYRAH